MADEAVDERRDLLGELGWLVGQLGQGLGEAVARGHVAPAQRPQELHVVVAGDAQGVAVGHHADRQPKDRRRSRPTIDEIADEETPAALGVVGTRSIVLDDVAKRGEQGSQLVEAAVDVADDVEGAMVAATVGPQRLAFDGGLLDVLFVEGEHLVEALAAKALQRPT